MPSQTQQLRDIRRWIGTIRPSEADDRTLLLAFVQRRDEAAFAELFRRHGPMALGVCRRVLRNSADAEDACQAVFLILARKAETLRDPQRLPAWLYGVAWRTANKLRRSRKAVNALPDDLAAHTMNDDWPIELDEAIAGLPEKYRTPVVLCHLQGESPDRVAQLLGCPLATVATRLFRARAALRKRLQTKGLALPAAFAAGSTFQLSDSLARSVSDLAAGRTKSIAAAALANGVIRSTLMKKAFTLAFGIAFGFAGMGLLGFQAGGQEPPTKTEPKAPAASKPNVPPAAPEAKSPVAKTENFTVTAPSPRIGKLVADAAENARREQAKAWLGKELPAWKQPVAIHVILGGSHGGATTFNFDSESFTSTMEVQGELDRILAEVVPHEVTHCVLADYFKAPLPRWADEGIAMLSETEEEQTRNTKFAKDMVQKGDFVQLKVLFEAKEYPRNVAAFYAESLWLAKLLVERKSRSTLLEFVKDGRGGEWSAAAKKHYGYADLAEMESDALRMLDAAATKYPKGTKPGSPPIIAEATMDNSSTLTVKYPGFVYVPIQTYVLRERTVVNDRGTEKQKYYEPVTSYELAQSDRYTSLIARGEYKLFKPDGKGLTELTAWQAATELKGKTRSVLLSTNEAGFEPGLIEMLKPDTLVLIAAVQNTKAVPKPSR